MRSGYRPIVPRTVPSRCTAVSTACTPTIAIAGATVPLHRVDSVSDGMSERREGRFHPTAGVRRGRWRLGLVSGAAARASQGRCSWSLPTARHQVGRMVAPGFHVCLWPVRGHLDVRQRWPARRPSPPARSGEPGSGMAVNQRRPLESGGLGPAPPGARRVSGPVSSPFLPHVPTAGIRDARGPPSTAGAVLDVAIAGPT